MGPLGSEDLARANGGTGNGMTCPELHSEYDAFALGLVDPEIHEEIRRHLARECPNCTPEVRRSLHAAAALALAAKSADPPQRLRTRIVAMVSAGSEQERRGLGWNVIWASLALVAVSVAALLGIQLNRVSAMRLAETTRLARTQDLISAPDSIEVRIRGNQSGSVFLNRSRGVALIAGGLPQPESGKTLQMWVIAKGAGARPISAGTFAPASDGSGLALDSTPVHLEDVAAVAVTIEPNGGSAQPTSTPFLVAAVTSTVTP